MDEKNIYKETGVLFSASRIGREGTTLVELLMAVVLISIMASAIYVSGYTVLQQAQTVTITTAAHLYAKEGLEEISGKGYAVLSGGASTPQVTMVNPNTHRVDLVRTVKVIWHDFNGSTSSIPVANGYAEVIVKVLWKVPRTSHTALAVVSELLF